MKYVKCENARENEDFNRAWKQEGMVVQFEYTMSGTPKQNGHIEQKFTKIFKRVHAMINKGTFPSFLRNGSSAELSNTATPLENYLLT